MKQIALLITLLVVSVMVMAQSVEVRKYYLENGHETYKPMRHKFYFTSIENKGKVKHDKTEEYIQQYFKNADNCNTTSENVWLQGSLFCSAATKTEADVVISGYYKYHSGAKVFEKRMAEKTGSDPIPYFEDRTKNSAELNILLQFNYKDGSPQIVDTILISKTSDKKALGELEDEINNSVELKLAYYFDAADSKKQYINLPKLKIKDKALKEEFATVKGLLKDGEFEKAGAICKKVHSSLNSPESAQMLGICYELVGNYPKANEYYKTKPDFHINTRMKKSMQLLEYAQSIGYQPEFIDFN